MPLTVTIVANGMLLSPHGLLTYPLYGKITREWWIALFHVIIKHQNNAPVNTLAQVHILCSQNLWVQQHRVIATHFIYKNNQCRHRYRYSLTSYSWTYINIYSCTSINVDHLHTNISHKAPIVHDQYIVVFICSSTLLSNKSWPTSPAWLLSWWLTLATRASWYT